LKGLYEREIIHVRGGINGAKGVGTKHTSGQRREELKPYLPESKNLCWHCAEHFAEGGERGWKGKHSQELSRNHKIDWGGIVGGRQSARTGQKRGWCIFASWNSKELTKN